MKKSKLDIPHIREKVVKELAVGKSQNVIAKDVGLNQSSVSRFANRDDIRALIEQEQAKLLDCVPDAVQNVKDLVREMRDIPKKDTKRRELSYKASKDVLKSVGLLPTPIQSQTLVNLYQDNKTLISPFIQELLDAKFDEITADAST
jgi:predicted transcriptional regulator